MAGKKSGLKRVEIVASYCTIRQPVAEDGATKLRRIGGGYTPSNYDGNRPYVACGDPATHKLKIGGRTRLCPRHAVAYDNLSVAVERLT